MEQKTKPKTVSIVRKICSSIQIRELAGLVLRDIFLFGMFSVIACAAVEMEHGILNLAVKREFFYTSEAEGLEFLKTLTYRVTAENGPLTVHLGWILFGTGILTVVIAVVQLIGWLINWGRLNRRLRRYMKPIDDMALMAEQISAGGLALERLLNLEEAIDHLTAAEQRIATGDEDLQGLENAINNLLKRLRESYQEQTRFVDDASHELRTPIAVIQGYASMLERWGMDDRETLEEAVHAIREESEHMKTLVDQLLFLARGDGGRMQLQTGEILAEDLIKEICEESEMIDTGHPYRMHTRGEFSFYADRALIKQALRILTDNAAKYTPTGNAITLRAGKEGNEVLLEVQDEGIGLEAQEAARMFERFFRGDEVRGSTKGSGLGLSIARWIVERHQGSIEVLSFKDIGTRMTIRLPQQVQKEEQNI